VIRLLVTQLDLCNTANLAIRPVKGKGKGLDTGYSATYMSQTRYQQHFTISEVAG